jgi:ABC-type bacteriocin/lantibiotic exporter with double-glycine peptidase domain
MIFLRPFHSLRSAIECLHLVPAKFHYRLLKSFVLGLINSLLEVFSIASMLPVVFLLLGDARFSAFEPFQLLLANSSSTSLLILFSSGAIVFFFIKKEIGGLISSFQSRLIYDISFDLITKSLLGFYQRPINEFSTDSFTTHLRKVRIAPENFANQVILSLLNIFTDIIIILLVTIILIISSPAAIIPILLITLPSIWLYHRHKKKYKIVENEFVEQYDKSQKDLSIALQAYTEIKLYRNKNFFINKFSFDLRSLYQNLSWITTSNSAPARLLEFTAACSFFGVIIYLSFFFPHSGKTFLTVSVFSVAALRVIPSLNRILVNLNHILNNLHTIQIVNEQLKSSKEDSSKETKQKIAFRESILLHNLIYRYAQRQGFSLSIENLEIRKGQFVVLIGKSGMGKTTLLHILSGLLQGWQGQFKIDNHSITDSDFIDASYVSQKPVLLNESILANVVFGESSVNYRLFEKVIKQVGLDDFVNSLPEKENTVIGENGFQISGGQGQRIIIARALYKQSDLLLLDEATNHLDENSRDHILNVLKNSCADGATVVLATHDHSALPFADQVIEIESGKILRVTHH